MGFGGNERLRLIVLKFCILSIFSYYVPTPIHKWNLPNFPNIIEVWFKVYIYSPIPFLSFYIIKQIAKMNVSLLTDTIANINVCVCIAWWPFWKAIEWEQSEKIRVLDGTKVFIIIIFFFLNFFPIERGGERHKTKEKDIFSLVFNRSDNVHSTIKIGLTTYEFTVTFSI